MPKKIFVSFVLDETGSMLSVKSQTISGFNEYIETLKNGKDSKKVAFSLTKFNKGKTEVVHDCVALSEVGPLDEKTYLPENLTPLYDAIGKTIRSMEKAVKKENCLVVIQTDGQENSSEEYTRAGIFALIEEKKKSGWTFAFLGADQDAWLTGQALGIPQGNTMSYNSAHTSKAFARAASVSVNYVATGGVQSRTLFDDSKK